MALEFVLYCSRHSAVALIDALVFFFFPGTLCRNLWPRRSSGGPPLPGEFQEVAFGRGDLGDRGRGGLAHRPEAPVMTSHFTHPHTLRRSHENT